MATWSSTASIRSWRGARPWPRCAGGRLRCARWKPVLSSIAPTCPSGRSRAAGLPGIVASPSVGSASPSTTRIVVVLPAPLGPRNPVTRPRGTANDNPSTAVTSPNRFVRPRDLDRGFGRRIGRAHPLSTVARHARVARLQIRLEDGGHVSWTRQPTANVSRSSRSPTLQGPHPDGSPSLKHSRCSTPRARGPRAGPPRLHGRSWSSSTWNNRSRAPRRTCARSADPEHVGDEEARRREVALARLSIAFPVARGDASMPSTSRPAAARASAFSPVPHPRRAPATGTRPRPRARAPPPVDVRCPGRHADVGVVEPTRGGSGGHGSPP